MRAAVAVLLIALAAGVASQGDLEVASVPVAPSAAPFLQYLPAAATVLCRDGATAAARLTTENCLARYAPVKLACTRLGAEAAELSAKAAAAEKDAAAKAATNQALNLQIATLKKQVAARDSWLAGNATEAKSREAAAAAAAAATWAGYVAGNVTATAKTWEGWLAGNTTQATNAVSGADTQVAAAEAALEACTEDLQAAADANATCAAWELPAVEADRDYWKQSWRACEEARAVAADEAADLGAQLADLNATLADCTAEVDTLVAGLDAADGELEATTAAAAEQLDLCQAALNATQVELDDCGAVAGDLGGKNGALLQTQSARAEAVRPKPAAVTGGKKKKGKKP